MSGVNKLKDQDGLSDLCSGTRNPTFPKSSRKSLSQIYLEIYEEQREKAKEILSNLDGRISISVDSPLYEKSWTSYEYQYSITAHFIDNDWKLQKWVIKYCGGGCEFYPIDSVIQALKDWNIEGKLLSLTGDSDTADTVKEDIQKRTELFIGGELFHVQSSCDVLTRMVQSVFEMIYEIIEKVKLLSWSKSLPVWFLTTYKLQSALELEAMGEFSPDKVSDFYEIPSSEEWDKVRTVCRITDRIYKITKPLYEAKKQTANLFLPHLVEIHAYLSQESASSDEFVKAVAVKMLKIYTEYWDEMYLVLSVTAFLDPRYKMRLIEVCLSKLQCDEKAVNVLETIRKLYASYKVENDENEYLLSESSSESEEDEEMIEEKQAENLVDKLNILKEYISVRSENGESIKSDLDYYLEEPVLAWTENFSVLQWWKENCVKYPQLCKMARDFLAIPMSVASDEKAYYTEPRPADRSVASLKSELLNAQMCTLSWKFGCDC